MDPSVEAMPRLISFAHTAAQVLDGSKTVTRRIGWRTLKPGTVLRAVRRITRGRAPLEDLGLIRVVSVRRERLNEITRSDVSAEGFRGRAPAWFVALFTWEFDCAPDTEVTRIEFELLKEQA